MAAATKETSVRDDKQPPTPIKKLAKERRARSYPLSMKSTTIDKESEAWGDRIFREVMAADGSMSTHHVTYQPPPYSARDSLSV